MPTPEGTTEKKTVKQHYVPQFYLRQWTAPDGGFFPIRVENKIPPKLTIFTKKSSPSKFCYENYFYAQHTGEEDEFSQQLEKHFAVIEGVFSKELPKIEEKILAYEHITLDDKLSVSAFMLFLWIRGKKYRENSQKMSEYMVKEINKKLVRLMHNNPETLNELKKSGITQKEMIEFADKGNYTVDMGNAHHLALLKDLQGFSNLLSAKFWRVFISRSGSFIATDTPYLDMPVSNEFFGNDFFSREQSFVISPRVAVLAVCPSDGATKNLVRKDITSSREKVQGINCHNLMNSIRFGFHKDKSLLEDLNTCVTAVHSYRSKK